MKLPVNSPQFVEVVIRSQAPLMRGINDDAKIWAEKWRMEVTAVLARQWGLIPDKSFDKQ
jgi:hypothetical protein